MDNQRNMNENAGDITYNIYIYWEYHGNMVEHNKIDIYIYVMKYNDISWE
jgi:hypothetical protein